MEESWRKIVEDYEELQEKLQKTAEREELQQIAKEMSDLREVYEKIQLYRQNEARIADNRTLLADVELGVLAQEEIADLEAKNDVLAIEIRELLTPHDPDDLKNAIIEIRAGTGGDEAALFAGDLTKMYLRYAENKGLKIELLDKSETEDGGIKEIAFAVRGKNAFSFFRHESGVHRVQRIPKTETKGRLHTSAATVYVYPEHEESELHIPESEIRFDTFRASGAGGQSVNKTDSAVRLTHIPTGVVVSCQDEKSQHKNRAKAMVILVSRIIEAQKEAERAKQGAERKATVKTGDRSEKIRTWNFPQDRMTDHRVGKNFFGLKEILGGNMDKFAEELKKGEVG